MRIRVATPADAPAVRDIYAPIVRDTVISFELEVPSVLEIANRIASTVLRLPWLLSEDSSGAVTGYAYASRHRERAAYQWAVDVSAYVRTDARGQGVGKRLYERLLLELLHLGYCQAFAGIALPNAASVALHESLGFKPLGVYANVGFKRGSWHDVGWWQKEIQLPSDPKPPRPFDADLFG